MCKRLLLAVMLAAVLVMPGFANITTESKCDVSELGVTEGGVVLKANWTVRTYNCEPGQYLKAQVGECTICPYGSYCEGVEDIAYDGENHGIELCSPGWTSDRGAKSESQCYQVNMAECAEENPYIYGHGTAVYANVNTLCKVFYGNPEECVVENDQTCRILSLSCDAGYRQEEVDGVLQCVSSTVTCDAGTYMPSNSKTCSLCPGDAYCPGGDYQALSAEAQGITTCASGLKAPRGARSENDCGRLLHVGSDVLHLHKDKRTEHSLVVKVDGVNYYADATPVSEGVKTINPETTETLRIKIDGVEYSVHETIYE